MWPYFGTINKNLVTTTTTIVFCLFCQLTFSQGLPTELMELSFDDIDAIEIGSDIGTDQGAKKRKKNKWHVGYDYRRIVFDGYRDGTTDLSNSEVLWDGVLANRTQKNFPVLPDVITQELHLVKITYDLDPKSSVSVFLPFVKQATDHVSIAAGFSEFTLETSGIGDVTTSYVKRLDLFIGATTIFSAGISLPLGSIDETGDTPRNGAGTLEVLPYSMQLGSGTYDFPISFTYATKFSDSIWGNQALVKIRTGKNDRDYRLGNRLILSTWWNTQIHSTYQPYIKGIYQNWGRIIGADTSLQVPAPPGFPFPAAVTNPNLFGGQKINVVLGLKIDLSKVGIKGQKIDFEISTAVFQDLNGPQSQEDQQFKLGWTQNF